MDKAKGGQVFLGKREVRESVFCVIITLNPTYFVGKDVQTQLSLFQQGMCVCYIMLRK